MKKATKAVHTHRKKVMFHRKFQILSVLVLGIIAPKYNEIHVAENSEKLHSGK